MDASRPPRHRNRAPALWLVTPVLAVACASGLSTHLVAVTRPQPATLTGDLYVPTGRGPFPAVVLLHGCGGPTANGTAWAQWLRSEGYAALALDSFSGRNLRRLCGDTSPLTGFARAEDVFAAATSLKKLSMIDGDRIAAMGFSHGGWTVLWAPRFDGQHPEVKLRGLIAFYPYCGDLTSLPGSVPVLMLLGGADDWTPAEPCRGLALEARRRGRIVSDITYPNARHGFDAQNIRERTYIADARRGQGATIEYNPGAHADATKQVREFLARHLRS